MSKLRNQPLVEFDNLTVSYFINKQELRALNRISFHVFKGEIIGIVGESGCGKTTLGISLLKMLPENSRILEGTIKVDSVDVPSLKGEYLRKYRWSKVAMIFQSAMNALDPVKTIQSQMIETILQHSKASKEEVMNRIVTLLDIVGINPSRATSYPHELSGGMKQRVVIAMALCLQPDLIIADEPTTAVDVVYQASILRTLKALREKLGLTIILISHDISIMWEMTDRLAVMYAGKLVEIGKTQNIILNPQHPYTKALLNAVPVIGQDQKKIVGIPGSPPNLSSPPSGCRFHPRCAYAFEKCPTSDPPLQERKEGAVACWLIS
ncbi:MAG TPA: ABC transporter ATP-binding protein [Candidatus Bathyarchaeia archaeon]|nr:ABC transporter ATP-binding protein [Candidatus Bathyarchaeia archaeon]